jgi:hypothetical protein
MGPNTRINNKVHKIHADDGTFDFISTALWKDATDNSLTSGLAILAPQDHCG